MPWLELSLELDPPVAEAFSEALLEAGALSVSLDNLDAARPRLRTLLPSASNPQHIVAAASALAGLTAPPPFSMTEIADQDWVRSTQAQFAPSEIGARLWIGATWHRAPSGRVAVRIDPGLAFGTGTHPTTRLVLLFLETAIRGGESVLDYGCGSGILGIAAAKLGAARVDGVDLDAQAVATTAANARANRVVLRAALPEALPTANYDIVVSNILAQPLIVLAPLLAARAAPRGRIALSGILQSQSAEVMAAYAPWFSMHHRLSEESWVLLDGVRK
jgi:ribosomal protein L11 methyltransferase